MYTVFIKIHTVHIQYVNVCLSFMYIYIRKVYYMYINTYNEIISVIKSIKFIHRNLGIYSFLIPILRDKKK